MKIVIRRIERSDNPFVAAMIRKVFDDYDVPREKTVYTDSSTDFLYETFQTKGSVFWVVEVNDIIAGSCGIYPTEGLKEDCVELVKLYLAKDIRGLGIGKMMILKCINTAKDLGYKYLYLESFPQFIEAIGLYKKQGFKKLDNPLGKSGHDACTTWMMKKL